MEQFDSRIDVVYVKLRKAAGLWQDCAVSLNYGLRACSGQVVFSTHPEVCPGRRSLQFALDTASNDSTYAACRIYYMSERDQERFETVDWKEKGVLAARDIEDFYDPRPDGHPDYTPQSTDVCAQPGSHLPTWESWVAAGMSRKLWSKLGGYIPTSAWGSVDLLMLNRRRNLGIENVTSPDDETICLHQNHDAPVGEFKPTDRDMQKCFSQAPYLSPEASQYPLVNELWGPIP